MNINEKIGENIKRFRIQRDLTQTELAHRLGYSDSSTLARIEKGQIDVDTERLAQISSALGVTPADLFGRDCFRDFEEALINAYRDAPEHLQNAVKEILHLNNW